MDIELKFSIGGVGFSIDVRKAFIEQLKDNSGCVRVAQGIQQLVEQRI